MAKIDTVMSEFYDVLFKLRYPEITKTEPESIGSIILTGENRIRLLSWLLSEKIPHIAWALTELEGSALQDELIKYYSKLGICTDKNILLGNCTLEEQLPTLNLILEFIKNYRDTFDVPNIREESTANLLKAHFNENANDLDCGIPKLNYSEAINYFEGLKQLDESNKNKEQDENYLESDKQNKTSTIQELPSDNVSSDNKERTDNYILQMSKFIDAYGSVFSWPVSDTKIKNTGEYNMNKDIQKIHSNFMVLKQMLHMKNEIPKLVIPQGLQKKRAPLNSVVEDIVICLDENIGKM